MSVLECDVDRVMAYLQEEAKEIGYEKGREEGREEGIKELIRNMHKNDFSLDQISLATQKSVEEIEKIIKEIAYI